MPTKRFVCSKDAMMGKAMSGSFSGWNGKDDHLPVGVSVSGTYKFRSVLYFPVSFSGMTSITQARLLLYDNSTGSNLHCIQSNPSSTIIIRRMTDDWGEGGSVSEGILSSNQTWDWNNTATDNTSSGEQTRTLNQGGNGTERSSAITFIVRAWFEGSPNYGIMLINDNESSAGKGVQFFSRSNGNDNWRPVLEIDYETNTAPNPPTNMSPNGSIVTTLTPSLSGTRDDPDTGDYITSAQIKVHGPSYRYLWSPLSTSGDPTSGYLRTNGTNLYISETDGYGTTRSPSDWNSLFIVSQADPSRWVRYLQKTSGTDNGAWVSSAFNSYEASNSFSAYEPVYLFLLNSSTASSYETMWDSGTIPISGSPATFSVPYGSQGVATSLVGNRPYLWTAQTRDQGSLWSGWATLKPFKINTAPSAPTVVVTSTPINDINDSTPEFSITHNDVDFDDQNMYAYQIVVERFVSTWSTVWDSGNVVVSPATTVFVSSGALTFGGNYRVKARTQDSSGVWSQFSAPLTFALHKAGAPINLEPTGGELTGQTPTFSGNAAYSADVITAFWLSAYTEDLSTAMLPPTRYTTGISGGGTGFSKIYPGSSLTPNQGYIWKAKVEVASGDESDWSPNQYFYYADASVPTTTGPSGYGNSVTPTITGSRQVTFNRFQYEIYPSTATTANPGSYIYQSAYLSATISGTNPTTLSAVYGGSPALSYATTYKTRVRVSVDAGATWTSWSGMLSWTTDAALLGSPYSPTDGQWLTTTTPSFYMTSGGGETIDQMQVRLWNAAGSSMIWDSGLIDVANGVTGVGPVVYNGPTLVGGTDYKFDFRYQKTGGATGGFTPKYTLRINGGPNTPSNVVPSSGAVIADSLFPTFRATFSDPEQSIYGDYPTSWTIRIIDENGTVVANKVISSSLVAGENQYIWTASDYAFTYGPTYSWTSWFVDSKSAVGAYAPVVPFKLSQSPNGTITTPTNDSTVSVVNPEINWSYTGGTQGKFKIEAFETDSNGNNPILRFTTPGTNGFVTSNVTSYTIPPSYLKNGKHYVIKLTVVNTDGLVDPSPSDVLVHVQVGAPDPIIGLSITTYPAMSKAELEWDAWQQQTGHTFRAYYIYRRLVNDEEFTLIGTKTHRSDPTYIDWYAGHDVDYEYRVSVVTSKTVSGDTIELESPDDSDGGNIVVGRLVADTWMFVGNDRAEDHIQEFSIVTDEDHVRPVQQEAFETLGSARKVIIRGFVLGNEGNITVMYQGGVQRALPSDPQVLYDETILGRRLIDYLTFNKGPHILKSPFGDVWDVDFAGPEYKWIKGGHLQVTLSWIETGTTTSRGGSI